MHRLDICDLESQNGVLWGMLSVGHDSEAKSLTIGSFVSPVGGDEVEAGGRAGAGPVYLDAPVQGSAYAEAAGVGAGACTGAGAGADPAARYLEAPDSNLSLEA